MRFHLDEHIPSVVADGLRRRGISVTTTLEAELISASDLQHIEFARRDSRVIVTNDPDFLALHTAGVSHQGIVYCQQSTRTIGQMIEFLVLLDACVSPAEMQNHVEFM